MIHLGDQIDHPFSIDLKILVNPRAQDFPCLASQPYFTALPPSRTPGDSRGPLGYKIAYDPDQDSPDTDAYVIRKSRLVSVTPISLDLTSRVDLRDYWKLLEL
jgi:hypothetical protein